MRTATTAVILASLLAASPVCASALKCIPHPAHHVRHAAHVTHVRSMADAGIGVTIDEARMITFEKPAKTIYLGNPTIADINVIDAQHAFVLGKTFGTTNLIALDSDGNQVANKQLTVVNQTAAVTLNRGSDQFSLSCTRAHCESSPRPGDPSSYVTNTESAASGHQNLALRNSGVSTSQTAQNDSAATN